MLPLVDRNDKKLSITRQCKLLGLNRSTLYYKPRLVDRTDEYQIKWIIDKLYTDHAKYLYPYLLRKLHINHSNQVWSIDITSKFLWMVVIKHWITFALNDSGVALNERKHIWKNMIPLNSCVPSLMNIWNITITVVHINPWMNVLRVKSIIIHRYKS